MNSLIPLTRVAQRLGIPPRVLVQMSREGSFPAIYSLGRCKRVDPEQVETWLASRAERAIAEREAAADQLVRSGSCSIGEFRCP